MVVLGCNPEWRAARLLAPAPLQRVSMFRDTWSSVSGVDAQAGDTTPTTQDRVE